MNQDKPIFTPYTDDQNSTPEDKTLDAVTKTEHNKGILFAPEIKTEPVKSESPATIKIADQKKTVFQPTAVIMDEKVAPKPAESSQKAIPNQEPDLAATMFPPKKSVSAGRAVATVVVLAIIFIAIGFAGGFFGFRYFPQLTNSVTTTADSDQTTTTDSSQPRSTNVTAGDVSIWPIYNNTTYSYSVKFPDNWYSQNTDDSSAKVVAFTNFAPQSKTNTEEKVEITAQSANGQNLKTWIESQNTASQNTAALVKLTVAGQESYQQETTGTTRTMTTFVKQGENIVTIVYSADSGVYTEGKALYDKIVASFKLSQ